MIVRYLTIGHTGARAALDDVEIDGQLIAAGETVTVAMQAANRDPRRFADSDTLDLGRDTTGQLASVTTCNSAWANSWPGSNCASPCPGSWPGIPT